MADKHKHSRHNRQPLLDQARAAHFAGESWGEFWRRVKDKPEAGDLYEHLLKAVVSGDLDGLRPLDDLNGLGEPSIDDAGHAVPPSDTFTAARLQLTFGNSLPLSLS